MHEERTRNVSRTLSPVIRSSQLRSHGFGMLDGGRSNACCANLEVMREVIHQTSISMPGSRRIPGSGKTRAWDVYRVEILTKDSAPWSEHRDSRNTPYCAIIPHQRIGPKRRSYVVANIKVWVYPFLPTLNSRNSATVKTPQIERRKNTLKRSCSQKTAVRIENPRCWYFERSRVMHGRNHNPTPMQKPSLFKVGNIPVNQTGRQGK